MEQGVIYDEAVTWSVDLITIATLSWQKYQLADYSGNTV